MKLRYKKHPQDEFQASRLNTSALAEVLTGDDSALFSDLDAWIEARQEWKDLSTAFRDRDVITDNYNTFILEPRNEEERQRGYA